MSDIYNQLYTLLSNMIFNGDPSVTAYGEFWCQGAAIIAISVLVAVPFIIVWRIIRKFL